MKSFLINTVMILLGTTTIVLYFGLDLTKTVKWLVWMIGLTLINLGGVFGQLVREDK